MNQLNQKASAQNGAVSSGPLHCRGTPAEEDSSRGHCRQGGSGAVVPADTLRRTPNLKRFLFSLAVRAAAGVGRRPGRATEEGTEAQSGAGRQVKGTSLQGPPLRETQRAE